MLTSLLLSFAVVFGLHGCKLGHHDYSCVYRGHARAILYVGGKRIERMSDAHGNPTSQDIPTVSVDGFLIGTDPFTNTKIWNAESYFLCNDRLASLQPYYFAEIRDPEMTKIVNARKAASKHGFNAYQAASWRDRQQVPWWMQSYPSAVIDADHPTPVVPTWWPTNEALNGKLVGITYLDRNTPHGQIYSGDLSDQYFWTATR